MSRLRANQITNENANGAPNFPHGLTVTGVVTATTAPQTMTSIVVGSAVTANSQGIDVTGIVTATQFNFGSWSFIHTPDTGLMRKLQIRFIKSLSLPSVTGILFWWFNLADGNGATN